MVRKSQKVAFESISSDVAGQIILATTGMLKDKEVDPRKQIGTIHIKKYLAIERINNLYETWISLLKNTLQAKKVLQDFEDAGKLTQADVDAAEKTIEAMSEKKSLTEEETTQLSAAKKVVQVKSITQEDVDVANATLAYSAEDQAVYDDCKARTDAYLEKEGSDALKNKVAEQTDVLEQMKNIASSMKYKFSTYSFEAITHVVNLMVREILVFTCDNCLANGAKLTKATHVPWAELQPKLLSGLYMNTPLVYSSIHGCPEEVVAEAKVDESTEAVAEDTESVQGEEETPEAVKQVRPKLTQYITNSFKEIAAREPRFNGLLLGKDLTSLVNDLVYQVLDRYVNVIKSLLLVANSKTITDRLSVIATKIILQDDMHTTDEDVAVVLDVVQARIEDLRTEEADKDKKEDEPVEEAPKAKKVAKKGKKASE